MNCLECAEKELYASRDPDDWFAVDTNVHCRLADGRIVREHIGIDRTAIEAPDWCPRRQSNSQKVSTICGCNRKRFSV